MSDISRRQFLATATATAAAIAVTDTATATETPSRPDHLENVGDDPAILKRYQPSVITNYDTRTKLVGFYGWHAESSEYPGLRATYYWAKYPTQKGLIPSYVPIFGGSDSHFRDHEPIIVFSDTDTGEVKRVICSGYHHFVLDLPADDLELLARETDDATHPKIRINVNHHHYRNGGGATRDGVLPSTIAGAEFGSWLDKRSAWYKNDVYEKSSEEAVEDPFSLLEDRTTWWADGTRDAWVARKIWLRFGLRGADETDTLRVEE